jgi:hypothetical protein
MEFLALRIRCCNKQYGCRHNEDSKFIRAYHALLAIFHKHSAISTQRLSLLNPSGLPQTSSWWLEPST